MKKICSLLLITLVLTGCCTTQEETARFLDVRIMTFNIRTGRAKDGENDWSHRKLFVSDVIRQYSPDVLGVQEAFRFQLDALNRRLPEYGEVGIGRDGGTKGEYSAILYKKERFDVTESGTFWLSDTPKKPSKHWGNAYRRICTWAHLTDKKSKRSLYVYNTHLDHKSQRAREEGVQLIMKYVKERTHQDPFVLTGDFNAGEDNPVIEYLKGTGSSVNPTYATVVDSFRILHPDKKVAGTFNGFRGQLDGPKIDYIFVTPDTRTLEATIVRTNMDGHYPSDHFPVTAQLRFEQKECGVKECGVRSEY